MKFISNFFSKKKLGHYQKLTAKIAEIEKQYNHAADEDLKHILKGIKESNLSDREKVLHAMAVTRIASERVLKMRHFDVQIVGALALTDGLMAEMKTGEGKTLTCSAAVAANYCLGLKTHVATANEYLAQRDQQTLKPLYDILGISSSVSLSTMEKEDKKEAYTCDALYSTAQELGFDFLRDNLCDEIQKKVQNPNLDGTNIIVDEADFILIDEARTPLIISGEGDGGDAGHYALARQIALKLKKMKEAPSTNYMGPNTEQPEGDFWVELKHHAAHLSDTGFLKLEELAQEAGILSGNSLYDSENSWIIHFVMNAIRAEHCYFKDKDYLVREGVVVIIDPNTGRASEGRTWSNGLHQAIETKEGVKTNEETATYGSITIQNYLRYYRQMSGMSGTIMSASEEFMDVYQCETIAVPTNKPTIRVDHEDRIFPEVEGKLENIIYEIQARHEKGQPILIGTTSVEESEEISNLLDEHKIKHHVLNAKNHALEAQIIAQAGKKHSVTVSTSMAGRGTDIILGGNQESLVSQINKLLAELYERKMTLLALHKSIANQEGEIFLADNESAPSTIPNEGEPIPYENLKLLVVELSDPSRMSFLLNKGEQFILDHIQQIETLFHEQIRHIQANWKFWREEVVQMGGLCVIGTSRNASRRVDDQLRGRAGRQGDPGESIFFISLQDPWVRIFGEGPGLKMLKSSSGGAPMSFSMLSKAFMRIQETIERAHANNRKNVLKYDIIADESRRRFLELRDNILSNEEVIKSMVFEYLMQNSHLLQLANKGFPAYFYRKNPQIQPYDNDEELIQSILAVDLASIHLGALDFEEFGDKEDAINPTIQTMIENYIRSIVFSEGGYSEDFFKSFHKSCISFLDRGWRHFLSVTEDAQQNVAFSGYAQKDPLHEYSKICFTEFESMMNRFYSDVGNNFILLFRPHQIIE